MISQIDFITRLRFDAAGHLRLAEQVDDLAERREFEQLAAKCLLLAREIEEIRNKGIPDQMPKSSN